MSNFHLKGTQMDELRLQSSDGEKLILESQTGERFRLHIDDSVRSAVKQSAGLSNSQIKLSPREIQSAIRSGKTVDQLYASSGDPLEYIEKFAGPVLDELTHVLATALGVRISIAGDRYTDVSQTEFGDIIGSRLSASGVTDHSWSTFRDENSSWRILVNYRLNDKEQSAVWSFDIKKLLLSPENEQAIALSTQNSLVTPSKLSPVESAPAKSVDDTAALEETQKVETVIPIGRASERTVIEKPPVPQSDLSKSADLLDALKKKREERVTETSTTQTVEIEIEEDLVDQTPAPAPSPIRRAGRPSIPSFDEIVQGTKSEDE